MAWPYTNGSLLTLGFDGTLDRINPITGATTNLSEPPAWAIALRLRRPAGRTPPTRSRRSAAASTPPISNNLDLAESLYRPGNPDWSDRHPGAALGSAEPNPDGTFNIFDEAFFGYNGMLYATFDTGTVDFNTGDDHSRGDRESLLLVH